MKRSPALRDLSDDHHEALVLALRARRAAASGDATAVAAAWKAVAAGLPAALAPHFAIEEQWLAPPLAAAGEAGLAARLLEDHAALRAALADGAPRDAAALAAFAARLAEHVRFEERVLFPAAERALPAAALAAIAEACRAARAAPG